MMPNITRGADFRSLMSYLQGPGRANEHTMPHLVAGDSAIMTWFDTNELSRKDAIKIGADLALPYEMRGQGPKAGPVWHCSISLPPEDGQFTDDQWSEVAHKLMDKMGFSAESSGRSPTPWVAVHHGLSKNGNDHIHLVVSMVREDGTYVDTHNDRIKAQKACRDLEAEYGIRQVEGRPHGIAEHGITAAEQQISARTGREPSRVTLERAVRAAAGMATTEAQFVTTLREMDIRVAPYFAQGRNDVVAGYRVGLRGEGERMFGGGHLSRDLTLPRLRTRWEDTPQAHIDAAEVWRTADRADRTGQPAPPARTRMAPSNADFDRVNRALFEQRERIRHIEPGDTQAWADIAQDTAAILYAWSRRYEGATTPGPIAEAAANVRKLGQIRRSTAAGTHPPRAGMAAAATLAYTLNAGGQGKVGQAIFLRQLLNTMKAIHDAAVAMRQLRIAQGIATSAREGLTELRQSLPTVPEPVMVTCPTVDQAHAAIRAQQGGITTPSTPAATPRPLGRPIPNRPTPAQQPPAPTTTTPVRRGPSQQPPRNPGIGR